MTFDYETWQTHKDRPVWVRNQAAQLDNLTAPDADPVPAATAAVTDWVDRYQSVIARELKPDAEADDE